MGSDKALAGPKFTSTLSLQKVIEKGVPDLSPPRPGPMIWVLTGYH